MRALCVFCGSSPGTRPDYTATARRLGAVLAARHVRLVYGGARVGLMREVADAVLNAGGEVTGVIPEGLRAREVAHTALSDLRVVSSMHERKAVMADLSDGFVAIPGGAGTLEEFFEVWTWAQLGIHSKPCAVLNVSGYFDGLLAFLDHAVGEQFLRREHRAMVLVDDEPGRLLDRMAEYRAPEIAKWIRKEQS
jgi:uncharacterized protein (TIGR00730 family)